MSAGDTSPKRSQSTLDDHKRRECHDGDRDKYDDAVEALH
jgi:hypothetical protein